MSLVSFVQVCVRLDLKLSPASVLTVGLAFSASPVSCLQKPEYANSCLCPGLVCHNNLVLPPFSTSSCEAHGFNVLLAWPPISHLRFGLDNIGVFNRSEPLPTGGVLRQADGTAWMAFYCLNMCVPTPLCHVMI